MAKTKKSRKPGLIRRLFGLTVKLGIVAVALLAFYGVYLDSQIRSRIDGKVWDLPAAVYGRMVNLEPGMSYSQKEMVDLLNGMQYRNVTKITRASILFRAALSSFCVGRLTSLMSKRGRSERALSLTAPV